MVNRKCSVAFCSGKPRDKLAYYCFPKNPRKNQEWIIACNRDNAFCNTTIMIQINSRDLESHKFTIINVSKLPFNYCKLFRWWLCNGDTAMTQ